MGQELFLENKTAVVTGASAGIGKATALRLAAEGARVVLAARRGERLEELARQINQSEGPGLALPMVTDVGREEDIVRLAEATRREFGPVDILVNNAGHGYVAPVTRIDAAKLERIMRVNFGGAVLCTKHMLQDMVDRRTGAVVNIGSISSKRGWANGTPYVASKFALRGFALCLWNEVHRYNVRVINIYPDFVASEFFAAMKVEFGGIDQAIAPENIGEIIVGALRLPQNTNVVEVDVWPTSMQ